MLTTDQKGAVAELAIAREAVALGFDVYRPLAQGGRYDLILGAGRSLVRTQCKWAPRDGDVILVRCYSCRRARDGLRRRPYTATEADAIAAYCADLDRCFLIPATRFDQRFQLFLRLAPSKNKQRLGINWADDFDFEARLTALLGP